MPTSPFSIACALVTLPALFFVNKNMGGGVTELAQKKTGVLLVNLGTPAAPTAQAVRRYLAEFLWDKRVVDVPRPLWWLILNGIILRTRPSKVAKAYQSVWSEQGSPLLAISRQQQQALAQQFPHIPVALGMTYGSPSISEALAELKQQQVEKLIVLPLFPQYSSSTTASVFDALAKAFKAEHRLPELHFIEQYFDHPLYIQALANSVREYWAQHGQGDKLLMSFHGIPERYEQRGDPYPSQCRRTAEQLASALGLSEEQWLCSFQSRFGREEWVKPYTDATLTAWGQAKVGRVDVLSPAFAADCLETLEELEVENRAYYLAQGGQDYHYIPCLNARADHIELIAALVRHRL